MSNNQQSNQHKQPPDIKADSGGKDSVMKPEDEEPEFKDIEFSEEAIRKDAEMFPPARRRYNKLYTSQTPLQQKQGFVFDYSNLPAQKPSPKKEKKKVKQESYIEHYQKLIERPSLRNPKFNELKIELQRFRRRTQGRPLTSDEQKQQENLKKEINATPIMLDNKKKKIDQSQKTFGPIVIEDPFEGKRKQPNSQPKQPPKSGLCNPWFDDAVKRVKRKDPVRMKREAEKKRKRQQQKKAREESLRIKAQESAAKSVKKKQPKAKKISGMRRLKKMRICSSEQEDVKSKEPKIVKHEEVKPSIKQEQTEDPYPNRGRSWGVRQERQKSDVSKSREKVCVKKELRESYQEMEDEQSSERKVKHKIKSQKPKHQKVDKEQRESVVRRRQELRMLKNKILGQKNKLHILQKQLADPRLNEQQNKTIQIKLDVYAKNLAMHQSKLEQLKKHMQPRPDRKLEQKRQEYKKIQQKQKKQTQWDKIKQKKEDHAARNQQNWNNYTKHQALQQEFNDPYRRETSSTKKLMEYDEHQKQGAAMHKKWQRDIKNGVRNPDGSIPPLPRRQLNTTPSNWHEQKVIMTSKGVKVVTAQTDQSKSRTQRSKKQERRPPNIKKEQIVTISQVKRQIKEEQQNVENWPEWRRALDRTLVKNFRIDRTDQKYKQRDLAQIKESGFDQITREEKRSRIEGRKQQKAAEAAGKVDTLNQKYGFQ